MAPELEHLIRRARRRLGYARFCRGAAWRVTAVLAAMVLARMVSRGFDWDGLEWGALALGLGLTIDAMARGRWPGRLETAIQLDLQHELQERLSSAAALHQPRSQFDHAMLADMSRYLGRMDVDQLSTDGCGIRSWMAAMILLGVWIMIGPGPTSVHSPLRGVEVTRVSENDIPNDRHPPTIARPSESQIRQPKTASTDLRSDWKTEMESEQVNRERTSSEGKGTGYSAGTPVAAEEAPDAILPSHGQRGTGNSSGAQGLDREGSEQGILAGGRAAAEHPQAPHGSAGRSRGWNQGNADGPARQAIPPEYRDVLKACF